MANTSLQLSLFEYAQATDPSLSDEAIVRLLCERLLDEAEARPPVPVEVIASLRGITEISERQQPWAGMLSPTGVNFAVSLRASDSRVRKRFTICHEAAHTLFPGYSEKQYRCNGARTRLEKLCDLAGSELLLPRRFFVPDLRSAGLTLESIEELAAHYEASVESSALRSVDLWPKPAAVVVFTEHNKPSEAGRESKCPPRLRVLYAHTQGPWPYVRRDKSVSDDSPFGRAWEGELIDERTQLDDITSQTLRVDLQVRRYGSRLLALLRRP